MTQKEKAVKLVDKFLPILFGVKPLYKKSDYFKAKQCALIAVDEIFKITWVDKFLIVEDYWQEVKKEIDKL